MPTTETVAPDLAISPADVAQGLRDIADLIQANGWIVAAAAHPAIRKQLVIALRCADDVRALALQLGAAVQESTDTDQLHVRMTHDFAGVTLTAFAITDAPKVLRRDPEATMILSERDA